MPAMLRDVALRAHSSREWTWESFLPVVHQQHPHHAPGAIRPVWSASWILVTKGVLRGQGRCIRVEVDGMM